MARPSPDDRTHTPLAGRLATLLAAATLTFLGAVSCGPDGHLPPPGGNGGLGGEGGSGGGGAGGGSGGCNDGDVQECHITLGEHDGVLTCYVGTQTCVDGAWSMCGDGQTKTMEAPWWWSPPEGGLGTKSFSNPVGCMNNPCDPGCQNYGEDPPPIPVNGTPIYTWQQGDLGDLPQDILDKGIHEPCATSKDCQFNTYCHLPASANCAHSVCGVGTKLTSGCNTCVTAICNVDPTCCTGSWTQACVDKVATVCGAVCDADPPCAHDKCVTGSALDANCDPCVAQVCASRPSCCTGTWDALCQARVGTICGESCPSQGQCVPWLPGQKDPACAVADLHVGVPCNGFIPVCNTGNVDAPSGVTIRFYNINTTNSGCNPSPANAGNCTTNQPVPAGQCINIPINICPGLVVGKSLVINPNGIVPECHCDNNWAYWYDGACGPPTCSGTETVASLKKVNLFVTIDRSGSMGWAAGNSTRWDLMVQALNSFFQSADSAGLGVALRFWPDTFTTSTFFSGAVAPQTAESEPNGNSAQADTLTAGTSAWSAAISPAGDDDWFEFVVPAGGGTITLDTHTVGNKANCPADTEIWLYQGNTQLAYDDDSGPGLCSRISNASLAAGTYRVLVREYGDNDPVASYQLTITGVDVSSCGSSCANDGTIDNCGNPLVPLGTLTDQPAPTDTHEEALLDALASRAPGGNTPTSIALDGAIDWAIAYKNTHPTEEVHVVLMTDGEPTQCDTSTAGISAFAATGLASGVITDVIGIIGVGGGTIDAIAQAGGGQSFFVSDGADTADQLLAAMIAIKGQGAVCTLGLPQQNLYDPSSVAVVYTPSVGAPQQLVQVANAAACVANGFYYDNNAAPTAVTLCPAMCNTVKSDVGATVNVELGCPVLYSTTTVTQVYEGVCPAGKAPQWAFMTWDTDTPGNSNVAFSARTSPTNTFMGAYTPLGTAQQTPVNTQDCTNFGPAGCPIDLFAKLGSVPAKQRYLELQIALNPSSNQLVAPAVNSWNLTYSCVDAE